MHNHQSESPENLELLELLGLIEATCKRLSSRALLGRPALFKNDGAAAAGNILADQDCSEEAGRELSIFWSTNNLTPGGLVEVLEGDCPTEILEMQRLFGALARNEEAGSALSEACAGVASWLNAYFLEVRRRVLAAFERAA